MTDGPRWQPKIVGGSSEHLRPASLPGDWNPDVVHYGTEMDAGDRVSEEFQSLLDKLTQRYVLEVSKVRKENRELKAQLRPRTSTGDSLLQSHEPPSQFSPAKISMAPALPSAPSTNGDHDREPSTVEQVAKSLDQKFNGGAAEHEEHVELGALGRLRRFLQSTQFDVIISCLLFTNVMFLAFQLQMEGSRVGYDIEFYLQKNPSDDTWVGIYQALNIVEYIFTVIFSVDVLVRIICLCEIFWKSLMNWIDFVVVAVTVATLFLDMSQLPMDPVFLRLLRLGKLARAFRMIILSGKLESFGLLLKCVVASVTMLGYATLVLIFVQCVCGMFIGTLVSRFLEDPQVDKQARQHVFQYWGTFSRTFLTMFEVLFANWAPSCRALTDNVSEWFSVVFIVYRCVVGFALLNVVNSVFVSQTLKIADSDEEYLIKVRQRNDAQYRKKLQALFQAADTTNDGFLTMEEFMEMLENPQLQLWLSQLQLEYHDLVELFGMIDTGDGRIDWMEFMDGAVRLKGQAKSMDVFRLETKVDSLLKSQAMLQLATQNIGRPSIS